MSKKTDRTSETPDVIIRFSIYRRRSTARRIYHRLLGLAIWTIPVGLSLWTIFENRFMPWMAAILGGVVSLFAWTIVWYTRMEPDAVVVTESDIHTEVNGRVRAVFPFNRITRLTLDGNGIALATADETLILADRDFTPDAWMSLKMELRHVVRSAVVRHSTRELKENPNSLGRTDMAGEKPNEFTPPRAL